MVQAVWNQHQENVDLEKQPHRIQVYQDGPNIKILTDTKTGWQYLFVDGKAIVRIEPGKAEQ